MRTVSSTLADAITSPEREIYIRVGVDWDKDGIVYGPASLDDLSDFVSALSIEQALTTDMPEQVRVVEGSTAASATVDLVKGKSDDDRVHAARYFSRFNTESPLAGKERLARPFEIQIGFRTAAGIEWVPIFEGRTRRNPVSSRNRTASLEAIDLRELLREPVRLPALLAESRRQGAVGDSYPIAYHGLESAWIVAYTLFKNGIYIAPPPRATCRYYAPMAGSVYPFIAAETLETGDGFSGIGEQTGHQAALASMPDRFPPERAEFETGPYFLGTIVDPDKGTEFQSPVAPGERFASGLQSRGRFEMWLRMPSFTNGVRALSLALEVREQGTGDRTVLAFDILGTSSTTASSRLYDPFGDDPIATGPTITASSDWQFIGVNWNLTGAQFRVGSTTTSVALTNPMIVWPEEEGDIVINQLYGRNCGMAEIHATPNTAVGDPWLNEAPHLPFTAGAVIDRTATRMTGIVPTGDADSWDLLQALASAELATCGWVDDVFEWRAPERLASTAGQTVQVTLTAEDSITDLDYDDSIDTVRNTITATATLVQMIGTSVIWAAAEVIKLQPRSTTSFTVGLDVNVTAFFDIDMFPTRNSDGTGGWYIDDVVTYLEYDAARGQLNWRLTNTSNHALYLVDGRNETGDAFLQVTGDWIASADGGTQIAVDTVSVEEFGPQPLTVTASPWRQTDADALGIAQRLAADLAQPQPWLTNIRIVGDPRLQLGDRVRIQDREGLVLDGEYWISGIKPEFSNGAFTQSISARLARTTALWDTLGTWDDPAYMWGA